MRKTLGDEGSDKVLRKTIESQNRIIDRQSAALLKACTLVEAYRGCPEGKWRESCVENKESSDCAECWCEELMKEVRKDELQRLNKTIETAREAGVYDVLEDAACDVLDDVETSPEPFNDDSGPDRE